jgi:hypothetical protein
MVPSGVKSGNWKLSNDDVMTFTHPTDILNGLNNPSQTDYPYTTCRHTNMAAEFHFYFLFSSLCGLSMFKKHNCSQHLSLFKIFKLTTCFGLNWPSSGVSTKRFIVFSTLVTF